MRILQDIASNLGFLAIQGHISENEAHVDKIFDLKILKSKF